MFCVAIGDIGKRIRSIRENAGPRWSRPVDLARALDISPARLNNYEMGRNDPPYDIVVRCAAIFNRSVEEILGENPQNGLAKETRVYYNNDLRNDSNSVLDDRSLDTALQATDPRTVLVPVMIGGGPNVWSAKGALKETVKLSPFFASGRTLIKIQDESFGDRFSRGTILGFGPDEYPRPDVYLFCRGASNPDLCTIRFVDPEGDPRLLLAPKESGLPPEPLAEWIVWGYCNVEIRGSQSGLPDIDYRPLGIGPRRR